MALVKHNKLLNAPESAVFSGLEVCGKPLSYPINTISAACDARRQAAVLSCDRAREREKDADCLMLQVSCWAPTPAAKRLDAPVDTVKCSPYFRVFTRGSF